MATGDLVALTDLKTWLGVPTPSSNDDPLLTSLITSVSDEIYTYLGRPASGFTAAANFTEVRDGTGTSSIALQNFPINSVASVVTDNISILPSPDGVQPGYVFDLFSIKLVGTSSFFVGSYPLSSPPWQPPYLFRSGKNNVTITYNAGYSAIPPALAQAAKEWCAWRYLQRKHIGLKTVASKVGETTTFEQGVPPHICRALDKYRKLIPA